MLKWALRCISPALALMLLAACGGDPLPKPELLDYPQSQWPQRAQSMSTDELFYVYRYHLSLKPPYDTSFADILGTKGRESVLAWIADLESDNEPGIDEPYLFGPIIEQAFRRGGYDLCADPETLNRAARALIRPRVARTTAESLALLRQQCVPPETAP